MCCMIPVFLCLLFVPHSLPPPPAQVSDAENTEYVLLYVYSPSETFESVSFWLKYPKVI